MKFIERVYPWLLIAPALLPVVIWNGLIYPYLVPKTLLFYALALLALAAAKLLGGAGHAFYYDRVRRVETWVPAALLVLAYVASYRGIDFYRSFWSLFIRGDGLLMLTLAVGSFYLILLSADRAFFERLVRAVAVVSSFVAVYGIGEWIFAGGRIGSLLGNAAFFAGYLGISFFATLMAAEGLGEKWRRYAYGGATLQVLAIFLTATRGTIVALGVALVIFLVYTFLTGGGRAKNSALIALIALIVLGGGFFALRSQLAQVPFEPVARLASISTSDTDVSSRLFIWKNMVGQIEQHLWTGVGAEHINYLFDSFYDPTQITEQWFDRSHNAFLDYAAQYGIGGLLLYLLLIAGFFRSSSRLLRRGEKKYALLFALLAVTYAVQNFFVFDTISSFWLLLGLLACAFSLSSDATKTTLVLPVWAQPASWVAAVILIGLIVPVSIMPAMAAYDLAHAYLYQLTDVSKEQEYLASGLKLHTYGDLEYGYTVYDMYINHQADALSGQARVAAYTAAASILNTNFNRYIYDARTALYLADVLSHAPPEMPANQDLLISALERTIHLSPKRAQSWYLAVNLYLDKNNLYPEGSANRVAGYQKTRELLMQYVSLVPTLSEPYYVLAEIDRATGETAQAAKDAAQGKAYYQGDLETAYRAAGYYEGVSDWANAAFFLTAIVKIHPSDHTSLYDLAKAKYLLGDAAGAEAIVAELRSIDPAVLATDQNFLSAITAYEQSAK